jgi:hypothetical protein
MKLRDTISLTDPAANTELLRETGVPSSDMDEKCR